MEIFDQENSIMINPIQLQSLKDNIRKSQKWLKSDNEITFHRKQQNGPASAN